MSKKETMISLEAFEKSVFTGDCNSALNILIPYLREYQANTLVRLKDESDEAYRTRNQISINRLVAATSALLLNNSWELTPQTFRILMKYKLQLLQLYNSSSFEGTDHLFATLPAIAYKKEEEKFRRMQLFVSLNSQPQILDLILGQPSLDISTLIWCISETTLVTADKEAVREALIDLLFASADKLQLEEHLLTMLCIPWMNCSYLLSEKRHMVRAALNKMILNTFKSDYIAFNKCKKNKKPKMLVMLEAFKKDHANNRCFREMLVNLKFEFEVVFVAMKEDLDQTSKNLYDEFIEVPKFIGTRYSYEKFAKKLAHLDPDIIYYQSVGIRSWAIVLANFRIAPMQCMTLGGLATSASANMDFVINTSTGDPECFTETIIAPKDIMSIYAKPEIARVEKASNESDEPTEVVKIAVVSNHTKLSGFFFDICDEINRLSPKKIQFHFFPNASGSYHNYVEKYIHRRIPGARVYPPATYEQYINALSVCDLRLATFPVGSTNTNIDCFGLGIPYVFMDGPEAFAHHDVIMIQQSQLEDFPIAQSIDDYIQLVIELIDNDDKRKTLSEKMIEAYNKDVFFSADCAGGSGLTADTFKWMFENRERLLASQEKVIVEGQTI